MFSNAFDPSLTSLNVIGVLSSVPPSPATAIVVVVVFLLLSSVISSLFSPSAFAHSLIFFHLEQCFFVLNFLSASTLFFHSTIRHKQTQTHSHSQQNYNWNCWLDAFTQTVPYKSIWINVYCKHKRTHARTLSPRHCENSCSLHVVIVHCHIVNAMHSPPCSFIRSLARSLARYCDQFSFDLTLLCCWSVCRSVGVALHKSKLLLLFCCCFHFSFICVPETQSYRIESNRIEIESSLVDVLEYRSLFIKLKARWHVYFNCLPVSVCVCTI